MASELWQPFCVGQLALASHVAEKQRVKGEYDVHFVRRT